MLGLNSIQIFTEDEFTDFLQNITSEKKQTKIPKIETKLLKDIYIYISSNVKRNF